MLKDGKVAKQHSDNGNIEELTALVQTLAKNQSETNERLEEIDRRNSASGEAQLLAAQLIYNTPREMKRSFTNISRLMVDPLSLADTCAAILRDDVQSGAVSLGEIRRESIYDHLRSVKGFLVTKGAELAQQQEINKIEGSFEEASLGKGL